jgi:hypothetical protein
VHWAKNSTFLHHLPHKNLYLTYQDVSEGGMQKYPSLMVRWWLLVHSSFICGSKLHHSLIYIPFAFHFHITSILLVILHRISKHQMYFHTWSIILCSQPSYQTPQR